MVGITIVPVWVYWLLFFVSTAEAVNIEDRPQREILLKLLRLEANVTTINGNFEHQLGFLRDGLIKRIRCPTNAPCEECFSSARIKNLTKGAVRSADKPFHSRPNTTSFNDLVGASVIFLNLFLSIRFSCSPESINAGYVGDCRTYEQCWAHIQKYTLTFQTSDAAKNLETIENILREVKPAYKPDPSQACFSAEKILSEIGERTGKFKNLRQDVSMVTLIMSHLISGECIDVGESVTDFLDDIFLHYGDGCERVITESGFSKLWNDLQMQHRGEHIDHGVQKSPCVHQNSVLIHDTVVSNHLGFENKTKYVHDLLTDDISNSTYKNASQGQPVTHIITFVQNDSATVLPPNQPSSSIYATGNRHSLLKIFKKSNMEPLEDNASISAKRTVRHTSLHEEHEHKNLANECLQSNDLLRKFITNENKIITSEEFIQICPALVQQTVSGVCNSHLRSSDDLQPEDKDYVTNTEYSVSKTQKNTWYAVAAVTVITLTSLLSLFMIPTLSRPFFKYVKAFFIGLAFGTMSGDVVLHIMPQYLGLHKHSPDHDHDHDHDHNHEENTLSSLFPDYLQRQLVFLMSMFLLFIAESVFSSLCGQNTAHHGHSHDLDTTLKDLNITPLEENANAIPKQSCFRQLMESLRPSNICKGLNSKAIIILLADAVHNFADGIAIAAGYSSSYREGLSTTIAVFFHELPHEIGDFVVLMNCGLSYWKAFFFNIISGLSAYFGMGLGLFTAAIFREWLLCITAGLFFFVVMGEMLPDMRLESKKEWKTYIVKLTGSILGVLTMILIAIYELLDS